MTTTTGRLTGKVAIITGASRGIGAATARLFAKEGASVVLAGRSEAAMVALRDEIEQAGGVALVVPTDVTQTAQVETLVRRTVDTYGRLDIAVNNAGLSAGRQSIVDLSEEMFDNVMAVNLKGPFLCLKYEIPAMAQNGGGAIVNVISTAGLIGVANVSAYVASKHGLVGLTKVAALEGAAQNIRVNGVAPGSTLTEKLQSMVEKYPQALDGMRASIPMARTGEMDEVAEAILWLCSDAASYLTGVTLPVDGGRLIQ